MGVFFKIALAIDSLCFSPPEILTPSSPICVLYCSGSFSIKSCARASFEAFIISSLVAAELA